MKRIPQDWSVNVQLLQEDGEWAYLPDARVERQKSHEDPSLGKFFHGGVLLVPRHLAPRISEAPASGKSVRLLRWSDPSRSFRIHAHLRDEPGSELGEEGAPFVSFRLGWVTPLPVSEKEERKRKRELWERLSGLSPSASPGENLPADV